MDYQSQEFSSEKIYISSLLSCGPLRFGKDSELEKTLFDKDFEEVLDIDKSGVQASCSVFNVCRSRALAALFISDTGELLIERVQLAKELLLLGLHSLGIGCEEDFKRYQRFLSACTFLADNVEVQRLIKKMSRPLMNRLAEKVIRDTLLLPDSIVVNDGHARQAALAAFLTTLRQSLGSCFATAPSILVHEEQPILFFKDLDELIGTGKLKKTVSGNEYSVPLSSSWGQGDLKKQFILALPLDQSLQPVWISPSLIRALQAVGVLSKDVLKKELQGQLKSLLGKVFRSKRKETGFFITSVEEILKLLLLDHFEITEAEYEQYTSRPKTMRHIGLVVTMRETKGVRQEKRFQRFSSLWEEAKRWFKAEADCALLKSWEFTLASFSEVKFDFCRWNFYSSLGVNWNDAGGIGQELYDISKQRIDETNRDLEEQKQKFEAISIEVDYLGRRLAQATSETEMQWLKVEYQIRQTEQYHIRQLCEMAIEKTNKITQLHQFLIDSYDKLMQEYFQEIYDADLHDVQAGAFDDSPAGFRLIYKYGRTNPSLWTKITSLDEYVDALVSFFTITEQELLHRPEVQGIEAEFSSIITRLANHVRSDEFLESALTRTALAHGVRPVANPLVNLQYVEKRPWVYTSGGSMSSLIKAYFCLENDPEERGRWVENETELLAFFIDTTRLAMYRSGTIQPKRLLVHSPTHAFLLTPKASLFGESWVGENYSYSWISYKSVDPAKNFYSSCVLDPAAVQEFCNLLAARLPSVIRPRFLEQAGLISGFIRPYELAKEIQRLFAFDGLLRMHEAIVEQASLDSMLYESVPYTSRENIREVLHDIVSMLFPKEGKKAQVSSYIDTFVKTIYRPIRLKELLELIKAVVIKAVGKYRFEQDIFENIIKYMRVKKLLPPAPVIFADSNWVKDYFAFVFGPVNQKLELWSVNAYGTEGRPITNWKMWVDGSRKDREWGVLVNAQQYCSYYGPQKPFGLG